VRPIKEANVMPEAHEMAEEIVALHRCRELGELVRHFEGVCRKNGLELFAYQVAMAEALPAVASNRPEAWDAEGPFGSANRAIGYRAQYAQQPFFWGPAALRSATGLPRDAYMAAEGAGLGGVTVPIPDPQATVFMSFADYRPSGPFFKALQRRLGLLHVAALTFHLLRRTYMSDQPAPNALPSLSEREQQCLGWIARGKSSWETAQIMAISERTVNFHIENVKRKFDVRSRLQLVYNAALLGLVGVPDRREHAGPPAGPRTGTGMRMPSSSALDPRTMI
jgi:DNA-binding CsgD family transcriptional regulator